MRPRSPARRRSPTLRPEPRLPPEHGGPRVHPPEIPATPEDRAGHRSDRRSGRSDVDPPVTRPPTGEKAGPFQGAPHGRRGPTATDSPMTAPRRRLSDTRCRGDRNEHAANSANGAITQRIPGRYGRTALTSSSMRGPPMAGNFMENSRVSMASPSTRSPTRRRSARRPTPWHQNLSTHTGKSRMRSIHAERSAVLVPGTAPGFRSTRWGAPGFRRPARRSRRHHDNA